MTASAVPFGAKCDTLIWLDPEGEVKPSAYPEGNYKPCGLPAVTYIVKPDGFKMFFCEIHGGQIGEEGSLGG